MNFVDAERLEFIKAICTKPADDNPRLAYADWLDKHDESDRAQHIRIQIEYSTLRAARPKSRARREYILELVRREAVIRNQALVRSFSAVSVAGIVLLVRGLYRDAPAFCAYGRVVRGFVEEFRGTWAQWNAIADTLAWHPSWSPSYPERPSPTVDSQPIRRVCLTTWPVWSHFDSDGQMCGLEKRRPDWDHEHELKMRIGDYYPVALCQAEWPGITFDFSEAMRATGREFPNE